MQPGLSRLAAGQRQLTPNRPGDAILAAKLAVLSKHPRQALCCLADWDAGPALAALADQAALEHPQAWTQTAAPAASGDLAARAGAYSARLLGWTLRAGAVEQAQQTQGAKGIEGTTGSGDPAIGACLRSLPAEWRLAGLLCLSFAEDFAVIDSAPGAAGRIPWLAVCLPSHWAPEDKVGKRFTDVHAPVADSDLLVRAAAHLPQLVCGPQRWQRFVWTLTPSPSLDGHPRRQPRVRWPADGSAADIAALAWLRIEHQTFIPIVERQQAVFTIKVELLRLVDVLADPRVGAATGRALHAALASMSDAVLVYRGLDLARDRLLDFLRDELRDGLHAGLHDRLDNRAGP